MQARARGRDLARTGPRGHKIVNVRKLAKRLKIVRSKTLTILTIFAFLAQFRPFSGLKIVNGAS